MKANVNIEFGSEELQDLGANLAVKGFLRLFRNTGPELQQMMAVFQQAVVGSILNQMPSIDVSGGMRAQPVPPGAQMAADPPPRYRPPGYGPRPPPNNVRPIQGEPVVDRCFPIEESRHIEPGWGCCGCATYNSVMRESCRRCTHPRCDRHPIVPPPPTQEPSP